MLLELVVDRVTAVHVVDVGFDGTVPVVEEDAVTRYAAPGNIAVAVSYEASVSFGQQYEVNTVLQLRSLAYAALLISSTAARCFVASTSDVEHRCGRPMAKDERAQTTRVWACILAAESPLYCSVGGIILGLEVHRRTEK